MADDTKKVVTLPPVSLDMLAEQIRDLERRGRETARELKAARIRLAKELAARNLGLETLADKDVET